MAVRKIKANNRSVTGEFFSDKMEEIVKFESNLEKDFYLWCEFNPCVEEYIFQPLSIVYQNQHDKRAIYTPDVLVKYSDSRSTSLIEIKYSQDLKENFEEYRPKFKAAIRYCREQDWKFEVITEKIRTPYLNNIKFLLNFMGGNINDEFREQILKTMGEMKSFTPKTFLDQFAKTEYIKGVALRYFWTLALKREIICDLTVPLSMNTLFYLSEHNYEKY